MLQVCDSPQANHLLTILQCLVQLSPEDDLSDYIWKIVDTIVQRAVCIENEEEGKKILKPRDVSLSSLKSFANAFVQTEKQSKNI